MEFNSWPKPPIPDIPADEIAAMAPPEIPEAYFVFGLNYRMVDGNPYLDIPEEPLDKQRLRRNINKSFDLFTKLVYTMDTKYLDEIRDVHTEINECLNKAKFHERAEMLDEADEEHRQERKRLISQISKIIYPIAKDKHCI
ncbi:hypothetical protein ENBRE01_1810 [Enteropsectra breve]|nr:hypothetical protein ENBRE01_1810 [Enteropsectra breve]